jgi:glutamine synthetase type III
VTHYTHWFQPLTGATAESMMLFWYHTMVLTLLKNLSAQLVQQGQMHPVSRMEGLETHLKQEVIPHGINISCIFTVPLCIPTVFISLEKHWIIKYLY